MLEMVWEQGHRNGVTDGLRMRLLIHSGSFPTPKHATQTVYLLLEVDDLLDLVINKLPLSCHQLLTFCGRLVEESWVNFTVVSLGVKVWGCEGGEHGDIRVKCKSKVQLNFPQLVAFTCFLQHQTCLHGCNVYEIKPRVLAWATTELQPHCTGGTECLYVPSVLVAIFSISLHNIKHIFISSWSTCKTHF